LYLDFSGQNFPRKRINLAALILIAGDVPEVFPEKACPMMEIKLHLAKAD
jgi:hypothetical protein